MIEMVPVRSVKQYWNEYIVKGIKSGAKLNVIKQQLLDAFQKEVFGQIVFKLGPETAQMELDELAEREGIQNILHNSFRKWRRLCILCSDHGIRNLIQLEDLKDILMERPKEKKEVVKA